MGLIIKSCSQLRFSTNFTKKTFGNTKNNFLNFFVLQTRQHSRFTSVGENIYISYGIDFDYNFVENAILAWDGEKVFYDYARSSCAQGEICGHYTQVCNALIHGQKNYLNAAKGIVLNERCLEKFHFAKIALKSVK